MADTDEDFTDAFSDDTGATSEAETQELAAGAVKGEQKAAPAEAETPDADEPITAPPAVDDDAVSGRIAAVLAERDKRQAAEKRAAELEAQLAKYNQSQSSPAPKKLIDPIDDPEGFHAQLEQARIADRIEMSEDMARMQHGEELVSAAQQWAEEQVNTNPVFAAQLHSLGKQRNPYGSLITLYKQSQAVSEVGTDLEAYKARLRAEWEAERAGQVMPTDNAAATKALPPSLAKGGGSSGQDVAMSDDEAFAAAFR